MIVDRYVQLDEYKGFNQLVDHADVMAKAVSLFCKDNKMQRLETATLQIAASSYSIVFSIRVLISQGYFPSTKILLRSLIDRVATIAWLRNNDVDGLEVWEKGWRYRERPEILKDKLKFLHNFKIFIEEEPRTFAKILEEDYVKLLHGESHGDLNSALSNAVFVDGEELLVAGPNIYDDGEFRRLCKLSSVVVGQFIKEVEVSVPRLLEN